MALPYAKWFMVAVAVTMLFGAGLSAYFPHLSLAQGGFQMLLMAGSGWVLTMALSLLILGPKASTYIHAMGDVKQVGIMALFPATTAMILAPGLIPWWVPAASVALSSGMMLRRHILLMRISGLPAYLTMVWLGALWFCAIGWVAWFHLL